MLQNVFFIFPILNIFAQTAPGVKAAVALLIKDVLWGVITPETVDVGQVKAATEKSQPYYAVPTMYMKLADFPKTA